MSSLSVAPPVTHQLTSAFRRPPGLTSPSPGGLPVSPHTSADPNSAGHSPTVGARPPSQSPASHPSVVQGSVSALGMPPVAACNGKPVGTALAAAAAVPPVTGYGVADYSRKVNNMFDIVEVPGDEVVRHHSNRCCFKTTTNEQYSGPNSQRLEIGSHVFICFYIQLYSSSNDTEEKNSHIE